MRNLFFCLFLLSFLSLNAQTKEAVNAVYKIRIAAFQKPFDEALFAKFNDLGALQFEPLNNGFTRVYLGNYLGKATANKVLAQVQGMGFSKAYIVSDHNQFVDTEGRSTNSTLQFSAVKSLKINKLMAQIGSRYPQNLNDFHIQYVAGYYRLSMGLFAGDDVVRQGGMKALLNDLGYNDVVLRQVRQGGVTPKNAPIAEVKPVPEVVIPKPNVVEPSPTPVPNTTTSSKWNNSTATKDANSSGTTTSSKWNNSTATKDASGSSTSTTTTSSKWSKPAAGSSAADNANPFSTRP